MFIEGLFLHTRLYVSPFKNKENPCFLIYYLIGWVFPAISVSIWSLVLELSANDESIPCWQGYGQSKTILIITAPMLLALAINTGFLINIIRILFVKLRKDSSDKATLKAIKATALLIPLLGESFLLNLSLNLKKIPKTLNLARYSYIKCLYNNNN